MPIAATNVQSITREQTKRLGLLCFLEGVATISLPQKDLASRIGADSPAQVSLFRCDLDLGLGVSRPKCTKSLLAKLANLYVTGPNVYFSSVVPPV